MAKKNASKSSAAKKPKTVKKPKAAKKPKKATKSIHRVSWLDPQLKTPIIDGYAREMQSFLEAMADGVIEKDELQKQEKRLVSLMKKIEPQLDDKLHEQVTQLLCEITVYDIMQMLTELQGSRPESRFHG